MTPEDEAFEEIERRQGGFHAKRQAAMDKVNAEFNEEYIKYRDAFPKGYTAPQQEPVAMYGHCPMCGTKGVSRERRLNGNDLCASGHIYPSRDSTTSPKRKWVGLTDEEREQHRNDWHSNIHDKEFYAIEAKLKEKNT